MKKILSLFMAALMLMGALCTAVSAEESELPFKDVKKKNWYYSALCKAYDEGIIKGKNENTFAPNDNVTRAELVAMLARIKKIDADSLNYKADFTDVKDVAWYADYVGWAAQVKIVNGYGDGSFRPNDPIKREELAQVMVKFIKYISMYRMMPPNAPVIDAFADEGSVAKWAQDNVEALRITGFVKGDENGNFNPRANTTRAEVSMLLERLLYVNFINTRAGRFNMNRDFLFSDDSPEVPLPFRIYLPEGYDESKEYPVLMFLHGNSAQGSDNVRHLGVVRNLFANPYSPVYDSIVVVPQCPKGFWWDGYRIDLLAQTLDYVNSMYSTDLTRQYVSGISMGGDGTWDMVRRFPEKLTAVLPVAGTANEFDREGNLLPVAPNEEMLKVPIFVAYDNDDGFSDGDYNREVIRILREAGAVEVAYMETSGYGHGICGQFCTREDFSSLTWLFSKVRER